MEFNSAHIEQLLEKYFEATTTVAEEQYLTDYFTQEKVAPHLEQYQSMFGYFKNAKTETYSKKLVLEKQKQPLFYSKWIAVAAVAVISFSVYFGNQYQQQREAEIAYQQTREAFELLATNLQKGKEQTVYLNEFNETKNKIFKK